MEMNAFIGRQPILDRQKKTVAYELLFRSGNRNGFDGTEENQATSTVVTNAFMTIGGDRVLSSKPGFINFPRRSLIEDRALLLPRQHVVVEILENIEPDQAVIDACRRLKEAGYALALDDIVTKTQFEPLIPFARYAKIDFLQLGRTERRAIGDHFRRQGLRLLAEKVETKEDVEAAAADGYELFQGYFFARPEIISAKQVPALKMNCLRLIAEVQKPELDFKRLEDLIRRDVALVRKLLCFVNSAAFSIRNHLDTISQAFVCLGENRIRQWIAVSTLPSLSTDKPGELMTVSLVRARFCELVAEQTRLRHRSQDCFLMGLLSLLDAMVGRPLEELIAEMALDDEVSGALLCEENCGDPLRQVLELARAFEAGDDAAAGAGSTAAGLKEGMASDLYVRAIQWADDLTK
jgi:c-di-GMP-related signal transduction protein